MVKRSQGPSANEDRGLPGTASDNLGYRVTRSKTPRVAQKDGPEVGYRMSDDCDDSENVANSKTRAKGVPDWRTERSGQH